MKIYNLEERTLIFSKDIIKFCKLIKIDSITKPLISQLTRSATSIGANYREANETDTERDFRNRIRIAKKEAKETIYWLNVLDEVSLYQDQRIKLLKEAQELMKILGSIYSKT